MARKKGDGRRVRVINRHSRSALKLIELDIVTINSLLKKPIGGRAFKTITLASTFFSFVAPTYFSQKTTTILRNQIQHWQNQTRYLRNQLHTEGKVAKPKKYNPNWFRKTFPFLEFFSFSQNQPLSPLAKAIEFCLHMAEMTQESMASKSNESDNLRELWLVWAACIVAALDEQGISTTLWSGDKQSRSSNTVLLIKHLQSQLEPVCRKYKAEGSIATSAKAARKIYKGRSSFALLVLLAAFDEGKFVNNIGPALRFGGRTASEVRDIIRKRVQLQRILQI